MRMVNSKRERITMDPAQIRDLAVYIVQQLRGDIYYPTYNESTKRLILAEIISAWQHARMES
jgi:hypothetical protein